MSKWKLYWVTSDGLEDCFVVAKNSRSAKAVEKNTNDFEDEEVFATKITDIPDKYEKIANKKLREWSQKNHCNTHIEPENLTAWPYYAEEWLLKKLGAESRVIEGRKETLIDDIVCYPGGTYPVGLKAMKEIAELTGKKGPNIAHVSYEGLRETIDMMLGKCIVDVHRLENYITESFIFAIGNKKYNDKTINEAKDLWKKKFTFGMLIQLIEERYEIQKDVRNSLELFLQQRNKLAHGLTKDPRYDIETTWGQKEIVAFTCLFFVNASTLEVVLESAYIASMSLGSFLVAPEIKKLKIKKEIEAFQNDPEVIEKCQLFFETFQMKLSK